MYVDLKITMADILSDTETVPLSGISDIDESATSEDGSGTVADGSGSEGVSGETLVNGNENFVAESLKHIDSTLTIILIVILLIWVSNHLHIVAKTFGKIGKGE